MRYGKSRNGIALGEQLSAKRRIWSKPKIDPAAYMRTMFRDRDRRGISFYERGLRKRYRAVIRRYSGLNNDNAADEQLARYRSMRKMLTGWKATTP